MKPKHIFVIATFAFAGWLAASYNNGVHAKYEEDVTDYHATLLGDTLPLQARIERTRPRLEELQLKKAFEKIQASETEKENENALDFEENNRLIDKLLTTAFRYIGVRYRSGQSNPNGFDCSGFTSYVFKQQNIQLTRSSRSQFNEGKPVADVKQLRKGDLVFFGGSRRSRNVGHVGIVTEVNPHTQSFKFIHASRSSGIRVDDSKQAYYSSRYIGARRIVQ